MKLLREIIYRAAHPTICQSVPILFCRNLGNQEARNEFNELFDDLVVDVTESLKKYSEIVRQLEVLLDLEKQTLIIKKKVATFSLDYDDNLVILIMILSFYCSSLNCKIFS